MNFNDPDHIQRCFDHYAPQMQPLATAKRIIKAEGQSYSYVCQLTFSGKFWEMSSGPIYSTLNPHISWTLQTRHRRGLASSEFLIDGTYGITSDEEGWDLFLILTKDNPHRAQILTDMMEAYAKQQKELGIKEAKAAIREAIGYNDY